ncbi:30S ribosomal protein S5 [Candidatus Nomurabacteria bacterium]|uniref:Small ribosomal subunit protein uS5 n=1 Tax=candidate division WWE3 bacterium TaxID=2053526 RepID=A0A955E184_UNCKA|nr:30S ribosomal protein S5 [candidate division WWE3 bacterium]MCB9823767.1 30S ribosomal protein S5 [Candidatus Nomurabacteria bacterium]MCB9826827.1 30S ribosomal protein S5 [Candidatus Nomurabacteria bacterium]MCB9827562.1 30S ribosomal protein S5 [Candidatus Nomurabacteria bacterium]HXK52952.1 30S ribosomal protein S5 [bacterium]
MPQYDASQFEERIVETKRVSKKNKGGNKPGFTALVVVGNKSGTVGAALGKAPDISSAIRKASKQARKDVVEININNNTIAHSVVMKYKASIVKMMPAPEGSGIIAGGAVRHVMELAGIKDVSAKLLGSRNKITNVFCTIKALETIKGR